MHNNKNNITKVGVFYDGNYFLHVSNFYNYSHSVRRRISLRGLHEFIRQNIADEEEKDPRLIQIVDAHYFRGRLSAGEASQRGDLLYYERVFEDILMSEGVTSHYLPVRTVAGKVQEKGIDVLLALEAFELSFYKRFDFLVLIASDGDYAPLVRKLSTLGTKVMLISWDFEYTDEEGHKYVTRTSYDLLHEVSFPVAMADLIEVGLEEEDPLIEEVFVPRSKSRVFDKQSAEDGEEPDVVKEKFQDDLLAHRKESTIRYLKDGYGFINYPPNNVFFHYTNLIDYDFNDLEIGDRVRFTLEEKDDGNLVAKDIVVLE